MMENEERHASYAAAAGSKSISHQTTSESVLDSWEEAAQDGHRSQELERSIEEKLGKMKQKQSGVRPAASGTTTSNNSSAITLDDGAFSALRQQPGESRSSADLFSAGAPATPPIRILKRPQSSGHLPQHGQQQHASMVGQSRPSASTHPSAASSDGRYARNGNVGRNSQQQQQRTLEERAAAYAEARMRIFGVADQQIHDDLPVQPKLSTLPRSDQSSPSSNANR